MAFCERSYDMSTEPRERTGEDLEDLPDEAYGPVAGAVRPSRHVGRKSIDVDVDQELDAVEQREEGNKRRALAKLAAHQELADISEVEEVVGNQICLYRLSVQCPRELLAVLERPALTDDPREAVRIIAEGAAMRRSTP